MEDDELRLYDYPAQVPKSTAGTGFDSFISGVVPFLSSCSLLVVPLHLFSTSFQDDR